MNRNFVKHDGPIPRFKLSLQKLLLQRHSTLIPHQPWNCLHRSWSLNIQSVKVGGKRGYCRWRVDWSRKKAKARMTCLAWLAMSFVLECYGGVRLKKKQTRGLNYLCNTRRKDCSNSCHLINYEISYPLLICSYQTYMTKHIYQNMVKGTNMCQWISGQFFEPFSFLTFLFATGNGASDGYVLRRTSRIPSCMEMIDVDSVAILYVLCLLVELRHLSSVC